MASSTSVPIKEGSKIYCGTTCYTVESVLGQGAYGKVVQCSRGDNGQTVALKLIEDNSLSNMKSAAAEILILRRLKEMDVPQPNWVKWHNYFQYNGYICLEYEQLDKSLMDQMLDEDIERFDLPTVRAVVQQVATALYYFDAAGVIHGDLKPDNVMLVDQESQPYRLKVIDFGLAHHVSQAEAGKKFGTLQYMAPELFLRAPYDAAVDVWSLGCMAASLFTGILHPLSGWDDYEMLYCIERSLGSLPQHLIGKRSKPYFTRDGDASSSTWRVKTPREWYGRDIDIRATDGSVPSLDNFLNVGPAASPIEQTAMAAHIGLFKDLMKGMLELDPARRLTPIQILQHPFVTLDHELLQDHRSDYVSACHQTMAACCQESETEPPAAESSSLPANVQETPPPTPVQELRESPASPPSRADPPPPPAGTERKAAAGRRGGHSRRRKRRSPERDRDRSRSARDRPAPSRRQPTQRGNGGSPCVCCGDSSHSAGHQQTSSQRRATPRRPGRARKRPRPSPDRCESSVRRPTQRARRSSPERDRDRDRSPPERRAPSRRQPTQRVNLGSPKCVCCRDRSRSPHSRRTPEAGGGMWWTVSSELSSSETSGHQIV